MFIAFFNAKYNLSLLKNGKYSFLLGNESLINSLFSAALITRHNDQAAEFSRRIEKKT